MICINAEIPADICDIEDELKAIYHSRDTVCIWVFKSRQDRNNFMENDAKIFVAGHKGMVGSAIIRKLERSGYSNLLTVSVSDVDATPTISMS